MYVKTHCLLNCSVWVVWKDITPGIGSQPDLCIFVDIYDYISMYNFYAHVRSFFDTHTHTSTSSASSISPYRFTHFAGCRDAAQSFES